MAATPAIPEPAGQVASVSHLPTRHRQAVVSSAEVLTNRKIDRTARTRIVATEAWQREAWTMFDITGELSYAAEYEARSLSQATLYAGQIPKDPTKPPTPVEHDHPAAEAIRQYMGGPVGQSEALNQSSTHLLVAGVSYHVAIEDPSHPDADEFGKRWYTLSNEEISFDGNRWKVNIRGEQEFYTDDQLLVMRLWNPHPRRHYLPISPVKPILPVLRELEGLTKHVSATIDSRLAGAGILFLPQEMTFPVNRDDIKEGEDPFVIELIEHMTRPITDRDIAAAVAPLVVKVPGDTLDDIQHLEFSSPLDTAAAELRREAIRRIALSLDIPPEILLGLGTASHWCFSDDHEVLEKTKGWITEPEVEVGDTLYGLNHDTGLSEWNEVHDIYRADVTDEPMLSIEGRYHSSLTTLGHRWPILRHRIADGTRTLQREWVTSEEFNSTCSIIRGALTAHAPDTPKHDDALVELVAWTFTEGGLSYRPGKDLPHRVAIYQSHVVNPDNCARIRKALTSLYGPARQDSKIGRPTIAEERVPWWREVVESQRTRFVLSKAAWLPIVEHCPHRIVDPAFVDSLTRPQLLLFIDTAIRGDGHYTPGRTRTFTQKDPAMVDALERAAILAGFATTRTTTDHQGFGDSPHTQHSLTMSTRVNFRPRETTKVERTTYTGRIWCPTVPATSSVLVRRKGSTYYSGQSAWQVEESSIKLHVEPKLRGVCNGITKGYLRPILEDDPDVDNPSSYVCWYDVTNLKLRPNRASDARDLHRDLLITDETRRRAAGFTEDDAPDSKQFREMLLREVLVNSPQLGLHLLPLAGINPVNLEEGGIPATNGGGPSNRRDSDGADGPPIPSTTEDDVGSSGPSDPATPSVSGPG